MSVHGAKHCHHESRALLSARWNELGCVVCSELAKMLKAGVFKATEPPAWTASESCNSHPPQPTFLFQASSPPPPPHNHTTLDPLALFFPPPSPTPSITPNILGPVSAHLLCESCIVTNISYHKSWPPPPSPNQPNITIDILHSVS